MSSYSHFETAKVNIAVILLQEIIPSSGDQASQMRDGLVDKICLDKSQGSIFSCATDFLSGAWLSCSVSSGLRLISHICSTDMSWINPSQQLSTVGCGMGEKIGKKK